VNGFIALVCTGLLLALRNRMALIYGFVFPLVFLVAFLVLYRHEPVPLILHMGQLLTVTVLGGACFGLPTTIVSERERGVWRRYRVTPIAAGAVVGSTLAVRFILLLAAALFQIAVAVAVGMPVPAHPADLLVAFVVASITFMSIGMLIAMLADTVPAVQALGQCVFLPMLMVGGVAVPLSSLPEWTQTVSSFLPGVHAVAALQSGVAGGGLREVGAALIALLGMGAASALAATRLLRWDTRQRPDLRRNASWLVLALTLWLLSGLAGARRVERVAAEPISEGEVITDYRVRRGAAQPTPPAQTVARSRISGLAAKEVPAAPALPIETTAPPPPPAGWQSVGSAQFADIAFDRLPDDTGLVSPIAAPAVEPNATVAVQVETIRAALGRWPPGKVDDPVQRTRNLLFVAAVPDVLRIEELERFVPDVVFERLQRDVSREELAKLLYWVAMHPQEGDDAAIRLLEPLGLPAVEGPTRAVRQRVTIYALKLLSRLLARIPASAEPVGAKVTPPVLR